MCSESVESLGANILHFLESARLLQNISAWASLLSSSSHLRGHTLRTTSRSRTARWCPGACPPPDAYRGRGPTETSYGLRSVATRGMTQETLGGAGVAELTGHSRAGRHGVPRTPPRREAEGEGEEMPRTGILFQGENWPRP